MPVLYDLRLDQAARAGGAPPAAGGDGEDAAGRLGVGAAGSGQRGRRDRHAARGKRAERRDLPAAQLRQSGARTRGGRAVRAALPDIAISVSSEILPEIKEYPRTSTTVINAYVQPVVRAYITALDARLRALGIDAPLQLMQSNGGLASAAFAAAAPAHIIESGPAAGVVGGAALARRLNEPRHHHLRHGRHDRQGRPGRERRGAAHRGDRGRRRRHGRVAAAGGRRLHAEAAGDRPGRGRRRRRLDLPAGRGRRAEGRAGQRGRRSGAGLLRSRRHRADHHRLQSGAGLSRSRAGWSAAR